MPSEEHQIISQLKKYHLGKWVSVGTAVWGCDTPTCFQALKNLIEQRIIESENIKGFQYVRYRTSQPYLEVIK